MLPAHLDLYYTRSWSFFCTQTFSFQVYNDLDLIPLLLPLPVYYPQDPQDSKVKTIGLLPLTFIIILTTSSSVLPYHSEASLCRLVFL